MAAMVKISSTMWTPIFLASLATAIWPAFPNEMGAAVGRDDSSQSSQKRRLNLRSGSGVRDVSETCTCTSEFNMLDERSRDNEVNLKELQDEVRGMHGAVTTLKSAVGAISTSGQRIQSTAALSYNVAFSARVGYNRPYLGETEVIIFDELVINNGDVYDPYTGKFASPVPGLYHFETNILSGFNATIETMIVMNGNEVARVFSGGFNTRGSGGNSVLLNMDEGDEVWVSVFFGNGDYVHGLWSTFSGFLVQALNN